MKIKTGDNVRVIAGKDKGKEGKVLQTFPKIERVVVENVNLMTRHLRAQKGKQAKGSKIKFPSPIHVSNLQVVGKTGSGRVGYRFLEKDGKRTKVRTIKVKGKTEDLA
jgi:large subunit ribosomal protein L24